MNKIKTFDVNTYGNDNEATWDLFWREKYRMKTPNLK